MLRNFKPKPKVAFACPGSSTNSKLIVERSQKYLEDNFGFTVIYSKDTFQYLPYQQRAQLFLEHLLDPSVDIIWVLRGGEGSADIIPYLNEAKDKIKMQKPKLLIGFSDFTALLIYFAQVFRWPVMHGIAIPQIIEQRVSINSINETFNLILGKSKEVVINDLIPINDFAKANGLIDGEISGGNLSLINISIKEIWELNAEHKILIIEDYREKAHVVVRTLKHLLRIGIFNKVKAIIFGDFYCNPIGDTPEEQKQNGQAIEKSLIWFASQCNFPVLLTKQVGHGYQNLPLVFTSKAKLVLGMQCSLTIHSD